MGRTHNQAFSVQETDNYLEDRYGTIIKSYGELFQRYFSITTEEPVIEDYRAMIKGKINGYKNLKDGIQYKMYYKEGTEEFTSPHNVKSVNLNVASDGTIDQEISAYLEGGKVYTYRIGFEYNGNCYIGESKNIKIDKVRWVDLGLPSGTLCAAWNFGATSPEEFGGYYSWGEVEEKSKYWWPTYQFYTNINGSDCQDIGMNIGGTKYDVATVKWGPEARMPHYNDVKELINQCEFRYGTYNNVRGTYVTGPNGNSIFLPHAKFRYEAVDVLGD